MPSDARNHNSFRVYRPAQCPDVEIWAVDGINQGCTFFHDTYTVCSLLRITNRGIADWNYRKKRYASAQHSLMLMEPGEMHVTHGVTGRGSYFVARIPPRLVEALARETKTAPAPHLKRAVTDDAPGVRSFLAFHEAIERGASRLEVDSRLANCVNHMLARYMEESRDLITTISHDHKLLRARDYIQENVSEEIPLEHVAGLAGLSRFHFLRLFRDKFGLPPHAYQLKARVTKAMGLIAKGRLEDILGLGFADQSHFIRQFKNGLGISPGQYAAMIHTPFVGYRANA